MKPALKKQLSQALTDAFNEACSDNRNQALIDTLDSALVALKSAPDKKCPVDALKKIVKACGADDQDKSVDDLIALRWEVKDIATAALR